LTRRQNSYTSQETLWTEADIPMAAVKPANEFGPDAGMYNELS